MSPNDVQAILNCINKMNRAIDYKQWERVGDFLSSEISICFQRSSIPKNSLVSAESYCSHLTEQLSEIKTMHRDYNFFITSEEGGLKCKTDFKIETYTDADQLITGASGRHEYKMTNESGKWKIAGITRKIVRLDQPSQIRQYQRYAS